MATTNLNIGTGTGGAGTATISLAAAINISSDLADIVDFSLYNANSPCTPQVLDLASGANTINATNCPALANAGMLILIPPTGNTVTLTMKGVTGDTGIAVSLTAPVAIPFASTPPTSFVITTNGVLTGMKLFWL